MCGLGEKSVFYFFLTWSGLLGLPEKINYVVAIVFCIWYYIMLFNLRKQSWQKNLMIISMSGLAIIYE